MTRAEKSHATERSWVFYYDGDCGFCTRVVQGLRHLDFSGKVQWVPFQSLNEPPPGLAWDNLDAAAYLDCGQGELEEGFFAFRKLTTRIAPLMLLTPVFWFPGMHIIGVPVYRWVARNRYRLSRCGLPPIKSNKTPGPPVN